MTHRFPQQIAAFIRLSRFHFLPLPMLMYAVGVAVAQHDHPALDDRLLVSGLIIELLVQLSTAYINDYWDRPTDRINTRRTLLSGGSGELTTGLLPPAIAWIAAGLCQGLALLLAIRTGLPLVSWLLLVTALGAAIFYTTPPLKLGWRGAGELATALVSALLVPQWAYSLQTGRLSGEVLRLGLPVLPFVMSVFVVIATPDVEADSQVGKRTLPVRLGEDRIAALYAGLLALGYLASLGLWIGQVPARTLILTGASLPLGVWAWAGLRRPLSTQRIMLLVMIVRAGLIPLIVIAALNWGLRG
jgi:1,4-dihydroxy-2-naphthoate octaprenyltransferase